MTLESGCICKFLNIKAMLGFSVWYIIRRDLVLTGISHNAKYFDKMIKNIFVQ